MSLSHGHSVVTDNLHVYIDRSNPKCWKGKPTTNLFTGDILDFPLSRPLADRTLLDEKYKGGNVYRLADADGVAFGSYVDNYIGVNMTHGTAPGTDFTFSFDCRPMSRSGVSKTPVNNVAWVWYSSNSDYVYFDDLPLGEWTRVEIKCQSSASYTNIYPRIDYDNVIVDIANIQFEQSSTATARMPINTTRSTSESVVDMMGNVSVGVGSDLQYNNDGTFSFDGSNFNSVISMDHSHINGRSYSVECWFKARSINRRQGIIGDRQYNWWRFNVNALNQVDVFHKESDVLGGSGVISNQLISVDTWYQAVMTFDVGSGMSLYINGELDNSNTDTQPFLPSSTGRGPQYIGHYRPSAPTSADVFDGYIDRVLIYRNKALTPSEVKQNFMAARKRYGI